MPIVIGNAYCALEKHSFFLISERAVSWSVKLFIRCGMYSKSSLNIIDMFSVTSSETTYKEPNFTLG